jgi:hypothetical protein
LAHKAWRPRAIRESTNVIVASKLIAHSLFELAKNVMRWRFIKLEIGSLPLSRCKAKRVHKKRAQNKAIYKHALDRKKQ